MKRCITFAGAIILCICAPSLSHGQHTWYVRPDGGSCVECTGLVDAPYPGSGTGRPCAWDHPFRALPPGGAARIAGGDTLVIAAGSYMMGYGAPGTGNCSSGYPWDCYMPAVPSGPDAEHPTRILGKGWDRGCNSPPELWGTERAYMVINLTDANNVEVGCLEITDHSGCVEFHSGNLACERGSYPFGQWASAGIYAEDSSNVYLHDLDIHGFADTGVHAGRLTDWIVEDVRVAGNGWCGWDGDIPGADSNNGTLTFRRWTVEWNGCGETYPGGEPAGCWGQTAGGYGDGVGTGATAGDWVIEESSFLHNTSDGLDLLYHTLGGNVTLTRVRAEGNAGNQIKIAGAAVITNCVLVGNCAFFDGRPFTYDVDNCRALGNTLEVSYTGGEDVSVINSTFYGEGDGLVSAGTSDGCGCDGTETLTGLNNLFYGDDEFLSPGDTSFLFYQEECPGLVFEGDYSLAYNVKNYGAPYVQPPYPSVHNILGDPLLVGPLSGTAYGMMIGSTSPAVDKGNSLGAPGVDFNGVQRGSSPDIGAYEYVTPTPQPSIRVVMNDTRFHRRDRLSAVLEVDEPITREFTAFAALILPNGGKVTLPKLTPGLRPVVTRMPGLTAPFSLRLLSGVRIPVKAPSGWYEIAVCFFDATRPFRSRSDAFSEASVRFKVE